MGVTPSDWIASERQSSFSSGPTVGVGGWWSEGSRFSFEVLGSGFKVKGLGFRAKGSGFRVQGSGCRVQVA